MEMQQRDGALPNQMTDMGNQFNGIVDYTNNQMVQQATNLQQ